MHAHNLRMQRSSAMDGSKYFCTTPLNAGKQRLPLYIPPLPALLKTTPTSSQLKSADPSLRGSAPRKLLDSLSFQAFRRLSQAVL